MFAYLALPTKTMLRTETVGSENELGLFRVSWLEA